MDSANKVKSLLDCLSIIPDPRIEKKSRHKLVDMLVISICAVICGAEHWTEFEDFGKCKKTWFSSFLELPAGIPSHDTCGGCFPSSTPNSCSSVTETGFRAS